MNNQEIWERISGIVIGLLAALGGPIGWFYGRRQRNAEASKAEAEAGVGISSARKIDADTLAIVSSVYQRLVADLKKEVEELNARVEKMEQELADARLALVERDRKIGDMKRHIDKLERQLNG